MLKKLLFTVFMSSIIITPSAYSMYGNQNNRSEKKSIRCLYGAVVENLENNSKKEVSEKANIKIFQNKKIDNELKKAFDN